MAAGACARELDAVASTAATVTMDGEDAIAGVGGIEGAWWAVEGASSVLEEHGVVVAMAVLATVEEGVVDGELDDEEAVAEEEKTVPAHGVAGVVVSMLLLGVRSGGVSAADAEEASRVMAEVAEVNEEDAMTGDAEPTDASDVTAVAEIVNGTGWCRSNTKCLARDLMQRWWTYWLTMRVPR